MTTRTSGYVREEFVAPPEHTFTLPDSTIVRSIEQDGTVEVFLAQSSAPIAIFSPHARTLRVSPHGIVNDDRAVSSPAPCFTTAEPALSTEDAWAALYALWMRRTEKDVLPLVLDSRTESLKPYLVQTGLAFSPPDAQSEFELLVVRAAFWQGAGAPVNRHWLQNMVPDPSTSIAPFPAITSFTRTEHVLTTHPLRPPKPAPGAVIYSRYIHTVNQQLTLTHIDANNLEHFAAYSRWQNSERVNIGWRERGPDEKHRKYLADRLADLHSMGVIIAWDGQLAGYGEVCWVKEDPMGTYVGGLGDYDQGIHILIGEEKFRGRHRFTAVMTSLYHACFLREPRTEVVVSEPRADLPIVPRLIAYLPQELNREFELPHKRAVYTVVRRERFFQAAMLY
uniref:Acyltransferase ato1 n=1 Tax=Omphalotus olearius TaxID=72120 RepID=ATO1_OMPOL|nr:RecName: Full=Acyltransferase ato1; AltName: Full=Ferrichrome A biosynthesis cluster protein ato1 [Omphalotus olearius]AAX49354.1 putative acyltransferase [Omphalotus olearius]